MFFGCCEHNKPTVMLTDVWTYNPMTGVPWTRMATQPPFEGVQATSVVVRGTEVWVCGGWSQHRGTLSQVAVMSTENLRWTIKSQSGDAPWPTRADHATAISPDGRWLYLFGGQHAEDGGRIWNRLKDTWRVTLPGGHASEWEQIGDLVEARSSPALMVMPTGWLVTLGGHWTPDGEVIDTEQADVEGINKHHESTPFRVYNDVLGIDLLGGGTAWKVLEESAPWPARDDCAACVTRDGTILIFGGGTLYGGGGYHQDVWRLHGAAGAYGLPKSTSGGDEL